MKAGDLLKPFGLELRKRGQSISSLEARPKTATAGLIIEFIGTQGVGKTTLNNRVRKHLKDSWLFREDLEYTGPTEIRSGDLEKLHRKILFERLDRLQDMQEDAWGSLTVARQMSKVLYQSLTISTHDFPKGFVLDEGVVKNFPVEVSELGPEEEAALWKNRALIYLRARDPDFALKRYQGRTAKRRRKGMFQQSRADSKVRSRIEKDNETFDRIVATAQSFGCPTVVVYVEDGLESNLQTVLEFERQLNPAT